MSSTAFSKRPAPVESPTESPDTSLNTGSARLRFVGNAPSVTPVTKELDLVSFTASNGVNINTISFRGTLLVPMTSPKIDQAQHEAIVELAAAIAFQRDKNLEVMVADTKPTRDITRLIESFTEIKNGSTHVQFVDHHYDEYSADQRTNKEALESLARTTLHLGNRDSHPAVAMLVREATRGKPAIDFYICAPFDLDGFIGFLHASGFDPDNRERSGLEASVLDSTARRDSPGSAYYKGQSEELQSLREAREAPLVKFWYDHNSLLKPDNQLFQRNIANLTRLIAKGDHSVFAESKSHQVEQKDKIIQKLIHSAAMSGRGITVDISGSEAKNVKPEEVDAAFKNSQLAKKRYASGGILFVKTIGEKGAEYYVYPHGRYRKDNGTFHGGVNLSQLNESTLTRAKTYTGKFAIVAEAKLPQFKKWLIPLIQEIDGRFRDED